MQIPGVRAQSKHDPRSGSIEQNTNVWPLYGTTALSRAYTRLKIEPRIWRRDNGVAAGLFNPRHEPHGWLDKQGEDQAGHDGETGHRAEELRQRHRLINRRGDSGQIIADAN